MSVKVLTRMSFHVSRVTGPAEKCVCCCGQVLAEEIRQLYGLVYEESCGRKWNFHLAADICRTDDVGQECVN